MNEVNTLIAQFAKANKISKSKLEAFAKEVAEMAIASVPQQKIVVAGRKANDETIILRQKLKEMSESLKGKEFTVKEIVPALEASHVAIGNALRYLKDNENLFQEVGKKDKEIGQRGRREILWAVA